MNIQYSKIYKDFIQSEKKQMIIPETIQEKEEKIFKKKAKFVKFRENLQNVKVTQTFMMLYINKWFYE